MAAWLALLVLVSGTQASRPAGQPSGQAQKPTQSASEAAAIAARAMELQKQGKLEDAAAEYRRLLDLVPKSWEARSNLGVVYAQLGEYAEAVSEYHRALALRPAPQAVSAIRYNLAVALYKAGRKRDAASELEATLEVQPDHPQAPLLLADCRLQLREWKQVIGILDPILEKDPENKALLYMLGTALMRDRQYERGQRVIDRILGQGDSAEAHLMLAIASHEASEDLAAEKELRKALELNPRLPTANALLGEILVKMGDGAGAVEALRRELAIDPNHFDSHVLLALLLRQDSKNEEAMQHLKKALTLRPGDAGARYQLALVQIAVGAIEPARQTLEDLVKDEPGFTEAHVSLATVYYRLGRREDGRRHQAIVQRLKQEQKDREDAERARKEGGIPPSP